MYEVFLNQPQPKRRRNSPVADAAQRHCWRAAWWRHHGCLQQVQVTPSHEGHATPVAMPGWTQQLKGQTVVENAIEGRAGNAEKMEMQHHRLMEKLEQQAQKDAKAQQTSGAFNEMSMMHQYMGQDGSSFLLMTDAGKGEPVMTSGGKCPAGVPTKSVRRVDDQHRNHVEPLARFLSGLHVCADRRCRQSRAPRKPRTRKRATRKASIRARVSTGSAGRRDPAAGAPRQSGRLRQDDAPQPDGRARTAACSSRPPA